MRHHLGVRWFGTQTRTPTLPGAPPSTSRANMECGSWSSARVFQTSGESPRRSGGCLNHNTNAGCWQAVPVTIHGRKWTPPGLAAGAHHQRGHRRREVRRNLDLRPLDCGLHGRGVGHGRPNERLEVPPGVVLAKGTHVEPTYVGVRQDRRVQDADHPDSGRQGIQRRRIHIQELRRLPVVIFWEALPDELQDEPRRRGVYDLRVGRLLGRALTAHHALQGRARHRQAGPRPAEGL